MAGTSCQSFVSIGIQLRSGAPGHDLNRKKSIKIGDDSVPPRLSTDAPYQISCSTRSRSLPDGRAKGYVSGELKGITATSEPHYIFPFMLCISSLFYLLLPNHYQACSLT